MIQESKLLAPQDYSEYHDVELANLESQFGMASTITVPQQSLNLLKQFEVYIIKNYLYV